MSPTLIYIPERLQYLEPPTHNQGARRVWPDSHGHLWITEWNVGQLARYDPISKVWKESQLPGNNPMPYAVYVDHKDIVWLSDFGANALLSFDPLQDKFHVFVLQSWSRRTPNSW